MHKHLKASTITGILFVSVTGSLLHFTYQWSGNNPLAGLVSPINESTWEHLKMLFFPMLFYSLPEYAMLKKHYPDRLASNTLGIIAGLLLIPVVFYTYTGILGNNFLIIDILTFLAGVIAAFYISFKLSAAGRLLYIKAIPVLLIVISLCFIFFTSQPPNLGLFWDPLVK